MNLATSKQQCIHCNGPRKRVSERPDKDLWYLHSAEECRDAAIARAEKAETWIEAHFKYLGDMENDLCVHGNLHVPVSKVREWFNTLVWFNPETTPEPTEGQR